MGCNFFKTETLECEHNPLSEVDYRVDYSLPIHSISTAYTRNISIVLPPVSNGCMYLCTSGGISSSTLPVFITKEGDTFEDGDVTWRAVPIDTQLSYGDTFVSTWTGGTDVILQDEYSLDNIYTQVKVVGVPVDTSSFEITNKVVITYSTGRIETRYKTLVIPIKEA